jgi:hypothetical protein
MPMPLALGISFMRQNKKARLLVPLEPRKGSFKKEKIIKFKKKKLHTKLWKN